MTRTTSVQAYIPKLQALADQLGLRFAPVDFEVVPPTFMMEVAVYGLPVRMPHWSFGVRWLYNMVQHRMGHSHIFEVVFPGRPNRAYLVDTNSEAENALVVAHVLGHADFSHNNLTFVRAQEQAGHRIVEQAAAHARRIEAVIRDVGQARVEKVLDAALALEQHIDTRQPLNRPAYTRSAQSGQVDADEDAFSTRFAQLPGEEQEVRHESAHPEPLAIPPHPERDLLWFIARYAPAMEDWERDIFLAVRKESYYFQPVFNCQIMNEGWASYWHARLLREADFLPSDIYVDCIKTHSDVVRPYAGERQVALQINPYHVGYALWNKLVDEIGLEKARRIMREEDDFGFIRNYLTAELAEELDLFTYTKRADGEIKVSEPDMDALRESILAHKFNFGAPQVTVDTLERDGSLILRHASDSDGRGLDLPRARRVLAYVEQVWRRPVKLYTVNEHDQETCIGPEV